MLNFFKTCFLPFKTGSVFENYVIRRSKECVALATSSRIWG